MAVARVEKEKRIIVLTREEARARYEEAKMICLISLLLAFVFGLMYPTIGMILLLPGLYKFWRVKEEFFDGGIKEAIYKRMFRPQMAYSHYVKIGYRVEENELERHLEMLDGLDSTGEMQKRAIKVAKTKEIMVRAKEKWREVGVSKKQLVTHFWIIGTTGAGKTSFIMTVLQCLFKVGGGGIIIDGKADAKMAAKCYNLAKESGREDDFYLINFLASEGEVKEHTHTFNPIINSSAEQVVEFLSSLLGEPTGDQAYWQGRGKALLNPIVYFLAYRKKYYGEVYTLSKIKEFIDDTSLFMRLCGWVYAACKYWEERIKNDKELYSCYQKAKKEGALADVSFPHLSAIISYYTDYKHEQVELYERGIDFERLMDLWKLQGLALGYAKNLHATVREFAISLGEFMYAFFGEEIDGEKGKHWSDILLSLSKVERVVRLLAEAREEDNRRRKERMIELSKKRRGRDGVKIPSSVIEEEEESAVERVRKNFLREVEKIEEIEEKGEGINLSILHNIDIPDETGDVLQQHGYAQQQWTDIFMTLTKYSHIFDSITPEVDLVDIIKNQKILYVLLPPLKQSPATTKLLGRIILYASRQAVGIALGGHIDRLTDVERDVLVSMITPQPLSVLVLDEYGSYPVEGLDTFLAQVRSINFSVLLSTQDYTSARAGQGEEKENTVKRAWANTQKFILRIKDDETLRMVAEYLKEKDVLTSQIISVEEGSYMEDIRYSVETQRKKVLDPKILTSLKNGCGVMITDDEPVIVQTYYADPPEAKVIRLFHSYLYRI